MIDLETAGRLLDFGVRIGQGHRAHEQLEGAVGIYNILCKHHVAYLADEVGMGKTYVALGALALFRHYNPEFRVLVIAPRENIQRKWMKELRNFVAYNLRFPDLRVSTIDRRPARPFAACENLLELVREVVIDPNRDFFMRLTSFSLPLGADLDVWRRARDSLRQSLPWMRDEVFDLRSKDAFKDNLARAVCCALPMFDLVIVDEAHNLKHGFSEHVATRNRVLGLAFGHPSADTVPRQFPGYGPRAKRVLFLSATPLEETYRHVWNQLDVFGFGGAFEELRAGDLTDEDKKRAASAFLVRRVTAIRTGNRELTKNQYRREWRSGGVIQHDNPIAITDHRQRLVVALIQKKVSELLGSERFNASFQMGMLASFESFLETARLKRVGEADPTFDDEQQTEDRAEREGIDVRDVNRLSRDYRKTFGHEMPHPKMDSVVDSLTGSWITGAKTLVFVRRVASVAELKRRLDERYDIWLIGLLRERLPAAISDRFDALVARYQAERREVEDARKAYGGENPDSDPSSEGALDDRGGTDTFFAWFFRGEGPRGVVSGATVQRRFIQRGAAYSTFFEDNHVAGLLGVPPERVLETLARKLEMSEDELREAVRDRAAKYLSRAKRHAGGDRMEAAQAAATELLKETPGDLTERARVVWHTRYETTIKKPHAVEAPDVADWLEQPTFFTELRRSERAELRTALWPDSSCGDERERFRERELRAQLLATAARLGHAFIDLYILTISRLGSLELRGQERERTESADLDRRRIEQYLDLLDKQRRASRSGRRWGAFDELHELATHFELVLDVNAPDAKRKPLSETARYFGSLLRQQQPIGGMSGKVNRTLVQQFRMPGYPLVLVTTDLLQEGEDLHTFCSSVHHYGISWTPSAMEQRIGRIDRVRSQTDRRLENMQENPAGSDLLQVYYPHLEDSVELLQVQRVLERMNVFLRLMHEGLAAPSGDRRRIDVGRELVGGKRHVEAIREQLRSAFPVPEWARHGNVKTLAVSESVVAEAHRRFRELHGLQIDGLSVAWEAAKAGGFLLGAVRVSSGRMQPFRLILTSDGERVLLKCVSPIGRVNSEEAMRAIAESVTMRPARLGAILTRDERAYDFTVEEDVLLGPAKHDAARAAVLIRRVVERAEALERNHLSAPFHPLEILETDLEQESPSDTA